MIEEKMDELSGEGWREIGSSSTKSETRPLETEDRVTGTFMASTIDAL